MRRPTMTVELSAGRSVVMLPDQLLLIGTSCKSAPLAIRERLAFPEEAVPDALAILRGCATEALLLSTCNRTEVYLVAADVREALEGALRLLAARSGLALADVRQACYELHDRDAARHLVEVATGVDSLVVGDHQILGQVGKACQVAQGAGTLGPVLSRLGQSAQRAGKRARTDTAIGRHAASVSLAAVRLAQEMLGPLGGRTALVIGAGKTSSLVGQALRAQKAREIHVASRTIEKARDLAARVGGQPWPLDAVAALLPGVDMLFSGTSAPGVVLTVPLIAEAQARRHGRRLLLIDHPVPRDIDPAVKQLPGVSLYDLDDLKAICERNQRARQEALDDVSAIVEEETEDFCSWWQSRESVRYVAMLRSWADSVRRQEVSKSVRRLSLTAEERGAIEAMSEAIVSKLLHLPTMYIKTRGEDEAHQIVQEVYGLAMPRDESTRDVESRLAVGAVGRD